LILGGRRLALGVESRVVANKRNDRPARPDRGIDRSRTRYVSVKSPMIFG